VGRGRASLISGGKSAENLKKREDHSAVLLRARNSGEKVKRRLSEDAKHPAREEESRKQGISEKNDRVRTLRGLPFHQELWNS